jgi:hypothetical protein
MAHCLSVRSLGYGLRFIPFLRLNPYYGTASKFEAANYEDEPERPVFVLPSLLREGWQPLRETAIGDKFALVLLRKETAVSNGISPTPRRSG